MGSQTFVDQSLVLYQALSHFDYRYYISTSPLFIFCLNIMLCKDIIVFILILHLRVFLMLINVVMKGRVDEDKSTLKNNWDKRYFHFLLRSIRFNTSFCLFLFNSTPLKLSIYQHVGMLFSFSVSCEAQR